ncbi:NmrA/HSCARG family protein [Lentzea sp.]|uniref:NmrA/HSCARG family protein n=1 Tax=Lentzea sp. TaxID=56099 RepID=UPI002C2F9618|nr:NmrA/HSCARG family protein [Lentzea sp.]HUQ59260.1 NmrA/HSCARG family protein [Lentzea sp.]
MQGGAVVDALPARGARVRALVRTPESDRARALAARGVELAAVRTDDPGTLVAALKAADAFHFMTPDSHSPETIRGEIRLGTALVDAAVAARVPHVVFNSVSGAERDSGVSHFESKYEVEKHLGRSGLRAAVIRPVAFVENFATLTPSAENGELVLRMPLPDGVRIKLVAVKDIGMVAAAILLGTADVPGGAVEVVGDELTGSQIATAFGARRAPGALRGPAPERPRRRRRGGGDVPLLRGSVGCLRPGPRRGEGDRAGRLGPGRVDPLHRLHAARGWCPRMVSVPERTPRVPSTGSPVLGVPDPDEQP